MNAKTFKPRPTIRPSVPSGVWTKINKISPSKRTYLMLANEDPSNAWRFELISADSSAPTGATAGRILGKAPLAGEVGGVYEENPNVGISAADVYVYQTSGGALATLSMTEGD